MLTLMDIIFPANYVAGSIQYTFPWEEGQIPNSWITTPEECHVPSSEVENNLLQIVSKAQIREQDELSIETSTNSSFNDLENFDPAQY